MARTNSSNNKAKDWNPEIPNQEVRLRSNPGRRGMTTGKGMTSSGCNFEHF
ncbi:MAG: hypothetical protein F6K19_28890 [Cyanothece sp. SIO1E1]|nr:hypothetical protein [Cyanothece sp. SIO1E1]